MKAAGQAYQELQENVVRQAQQDQVDRWVQLDLKVNEGQREKQAQEANKAYRVHKGALARGDQLDQEVNLENRVLVELRELLDLLVLQVNLVKEACLAPWERQVAVVRQGFPADQVLLDRKAKGDSVESPVLPDHLVHQVLPVSEVRRERGGHQVLWERSDGPVRLDSEDQLVQLV